jgi:DNA polymerase III subunit gamma/tau
MPENAQYIVSARKYRPDSFGDLIGQDNIVRTLKNSIIRGKLAHAYLFCGPRGVGKTSAARIFAKIINCASPTEDMEPCGHCESCVSFREGRSYCIHELDAASNNGVDDIKMLMDQVQVPPQIGKYSVYIIDEVHMLSPAAFNAFLKTLEEPPAHAIFILATTEKHKILPTILSRCQTYDFNRISIPDIVRNLRDIASRESISIDDESLHIIARKADGAMRDALTIFDQTVAFCGNDVKYEDVLKNLNVLDYEHCFQLTESMLSNDYAAALMKLDEVLSKGFNALYFIASLSTHFRNLIVAGNDALDALLDFPDSLKIRYREQSAKCGLQFLYNALSITSQCESGYRESINPRLHIEFALMKLCFLTGGEVSLTAKSVAVPSAKPSASQAASPASRPATVSARTIEPAPAAAETRAENATAQAIGSETGSVAAMPAETPVEPAEPSAPAQASPAPSPVAEVPAVQAPAPAPQTSASVSAPAQPQTRASRRGSRSASALSLGAIKDGAGKESASASSGSELSDSIPDDNSIMMQWRRLPEEYTDRPRLAGTLATSKVNIIQKDGYKQVDFFVLNLAQKKWVVDVLLKELEGKLQQALRSSKVRLNVEVIPEEKVEKKIYMPQDKAKVMMSSNEEIQNLVKDFDLDVK